MRVFLDTNAFYNNWFVSNANFKLLFYFLNNEKNDLLLSDLVVQETNNIRNRELEDVLSDMDKLLKKGSKLNGTKLDIDRESLGITTYDLREFIDEKVDWVEIISYESVSHTEVVGRAISLIKPFTGEEKGYRDTLIWLSFLKYLKDESIEGDVAFITKNKDDFYKGSKKSGFSFNDDLKTDIEKYEIKANIKPYVSIYDFIDENVDQIAHSFNRQELLDNEERFFIDETESYLSNMSNDEISSLLNARIFSDKLTSVISIEADTFEGIEDPEIKSVKRLPENDVYIDCSYEMHGIDLKISVDLVEYKQYADELEGIRSLYNIEINEDYVMLSFILRLCIDATFEYNAKDNIPSNLSIEIIYNRDGE